MARRVGKPIGPTCNRTDQAEHSRYMLATPHMTAMVVPNEGGRVSSLLDKQTNVEFLMQAPYPRRLRTHSVDARFEDGAPGGIEECLPSVGACGAWGDNWAIPDHGDFWQLSWQVEMYAESTLRQSATGFSRPLQIHKELSVNGRCLQIIYRISNLANEPTAFLYACHPLLAVDEGDVVLLPDEVTSVLLNYSRDERIGRPGDWVSWPLTHTLGQDLSVVLLPKANTAEMFYTKRLTEGWAAVYRTAARQGIVVRFRTDELPYLGVWLCYGGWPNCGDEPRQYAVALEPTTAPYGTLCEAEEQNAAIELAAGGEYCFEIAFSVSDPDVSLDAFRKFCEGTAEA